MNIFKIPIKLAKITPFSCQNSYNRMANLYFIFLELELCGRTVKRKL